MATSIIYFFLGSHHFFDFSLSLQFDKGGFHWNFALTNCDLIFCRNDHLFKQKYQLILFGTAMFQKKIIPNLTLCDTKRFNWLEISTLVVHDTFFRSNVLIALFWNCNFPKKRVALNVTLCDTKWFTINLKYPIFVVHYSSPEQMFGFIFWECNLSNTTPATALCNTKGFVCSELLRKKLCTQKLFRIERFYFFFFFHQNAVLFLN